MPGFDQASTLEARADTTRFGVVSMRTFTQTTFQVPSRVVGPGGLSCVRAHPAPIHFTRSIHDNCIQSVPTTESLLCSQNETGSNLISVRRFTPSAAPSSLPLNNSPEKSERRHCTMLSLRSLKRFCGMFLRDLRRYSG